MDSMRRAVLYSYLEKYGAFVISFVSSIILARLLSPAEVGAFSLAVVVFGLAGMMRDFGLGTYLIQSEQVDVQKVQAAFTVALFTGVVLASCLALFAFPFAAYYGNQKLRELLWILSLTLLISPLGATTMALLARELRFQDIATINLAAAVLNSVTAIACAWAGLSSTSLALGMLVSALITALLARFFRDARYPVRLSFRGVHEMVSFGGRSTITNMSNELVASAPDLALGKFASLQSVGEFSRASGLAQALNQTVLRGLWPVLLPYFSRLKQESDSVIGEAYLRLVACLTGVGWVFFAMMALVAPELVQFLYGSAWLGVVPVLQMISVMAIFTIGFSFTISVLTALGEVNGLARASLGSLIPRLAAILVFAQFGAVWAAFGLGLANMLLGGLLQHQVGRRIGIPFFTFVRMNLTSGFLCVMACLGPIALRVWVDLFPRQFPFALDTASSRGALIFLILAGVLCLAGGALGLRLGNHPLRALILSAVNRQTS